MKSKLRARIVGLGSYLPERVLANAELETLVDTSNDWIVSRTGIEERRIAGPEEWASTMGAASAKRALEDANVMPEDVDLILVATMTPDYISPSTAGIIQHSIGAVKSAAVDLQAACSGFLYALATAKAYVESGMYKIVLVVASEKMSAFIDYTDRNTCILFGDGSCSVVVSGEGDGWAVDTVTLGAQGEYADMIIIPGGGARHPAKTETIDQKLHYFQQQGKEVFKHAVRRMAAVAQETIEKAGLRKEEISWLVPHQANGRIIDAVAKFFEISAEKVIRTVGKYGNTSAASIAIALEELLKIAEHPKGEHILLVAFGGGFTWGAAVITKI